MDLKSIEIVSDERVGEGGFLKLRRMRLKLVREDGSTTAEGLWDYVERAMGLDAVVLALYRPAQDGSVEVLLRSGVRVPVQFGRPHPPEKLLLPELVAGILEEGDDLAQRAAQEALEEAGLHVDPQSVRALGPPMYPSPGMCAEMFHFACAEVHGEEPVQPKGDGSPFEEGARIEWISLGEALDRCERGEIQDLKTEIGLRRLRDALG